MLSKFWKYVKKYKQEENGATAVEFALVALPFLLMIFGTMEAGRIMWIMNSVQYIVEDTARFAALNSDLSNNNFQTYAEDALSKILIQPDTLVISSSAFSSNNVSFIEIEGDFQVSTIIRDFIPGTHGIFDFEAVVKRPIVE